MTTTGSREAELLARAAAGSEAAFEVLIVSLADAAYRLALTMLRDHGEAEDAVQESRRPPARSRRGRPWTVERWQGDNKLMTPDGGMDTIR